MGKSLGSKAARRRWKDAKAAGLPELAEIPKREDNGRIDRGGKSRNPAIETLKARCRQMEKTITKANLREVRAPWWGCYAGRVIAQEQMEDRDRADLWAAICHMRRVQVAFDAAIGAPRRHAQCLRLLAPVDAMEVDASTPPADRRSPEEKQDAATSALMRLETWMGYADKAAAGEAKRVVLDDQISTDPEGMILALRCVSAGIKGRRLVYIGRDAR